MAKPCITLGISIFIFLSPIGNNAKITSIIPNQLSAYKPQQLQYNQAEKSVTLDGGPFTKLCLARIVTTVQNVIGIALEESTEYEITFGYLTKDEKIANNRKHTQLNKNPVETVTKAGYKIVKVKRYVSCSPGLWYKKTSVTNVNGKTTVQIRIIPEKNSMSGFPDLDVLKHDYKPDSSLHITEDDSNKNTVKTLYDKILDTFGDQLAQNGGNINELIPEELCEDVDIEEEAGEKSSLVKFRDDNGVNYCYSIPDTRQDDLVQIGCPQDISKIPEMSFSDGKKFFGKYTTPDGKQHCYYILDLNVNPIVCRSDPNMLPEFNPNNLKHKIPEVLLPDNQVAEKYVDANGVVHCYTGQIGNEIMCPSDSSNIPEIDSSKHVVKYIDDNNKEHCYLSSEISFSITCPDNTLNIPELSLSDEKPLLVTHKDKNGVVHCYNRGNTIVNEVACPSDTSMLPAYNPYPSNNIVKYRDDNNVEHCYYNLGDKLEVTTCPYEKFKIPELPLSDERQIPVKYVDNKGVTHCYYRGNTIVNEVACPSDTSVLPAFNPSKHIVKYTDDNNVANCFFNLGNKLEITACPYDTSEIPEITLSDERLIPVKYQDNKGVTHCYFRGATVVKKVACPPETFMLPTYNPNPTKDIVKYTDDNNVENCFFNLGNKLQATGCPYDTSEVPELPLSDERKIPVKYEDNNGVTHCYYRGDTIVNEVACPSDTSMLPAYNPNPTKDIVKYIDDNNVENCYFNHGEQLKVTACPYDTSEIPELPLSDERLIPVKYQDKKGVIHCYLRGEIIVYDVTCPSDTSTLPAYNPTKHIAKYIDDNNVEHCYFNLGEQLKVTTCPYDTSEVPALSLSDEKLIPVKYEDNKGVIHCYYRGNTIVNEVACPSDTSMMPTYNPTKDIVKYIDDNNAENCFLSHGNKLKLTTCPYDTSEIPELSLSDERLIPVKYQDKKGVTHCYYRGNTIVNEVACPSDTSMMPTYKPTKDVVKYIDDNNVENCYFNRGNKLKVTSCPYDTSEVPELPLSDKRLIPVKYVDNKGVTQCYYRGITIVNEVACPSDTSKLPAYNPTKDIVKYTDDNNVENCFFNRGNKLKVTACPHDTSEVPELPLSNERLIPVKHKDNNGVTHCYYRGITIANEVACPKDTSMLPVYNPDIVKYKDDNNVEHCYFNLGKKLQVTACPHDTFGIPELSLSDERQIPVKYQDNKGVTHCYYRGNTVVNEVACPSDTSMLPAYIPTKDIVKYTDDNKVENCFINRGNSLKVTACPHDTSEVPELPLSNERLIPVKYEDNNGVTHCYYRGITIENEVACPSDTSMLPAYNPYKLLAVLRDDNNKDFCYRELRYNFQQLACSGDTSKMSKLQLSDTKLLLVQHVDPNNVAHCYYIGKQVVKTAVCPSDTSLLPAYNPYKDFVKIVDDNNKEFCYNKFRNQLKGRVCPADTSTIPIMKLSDGKPVPHKYVDSLGVVQCFNVGERVVIKIMCPPDTDMLPAYNPYKNLFRITGDNNQDYCYSMYMNKFNPRTCYGDTSKISVLQFSDDRLAPVKYMNSQGIVNCYDVGETVVNVIACPPDNYLLAEYNPFKNLVKFKDDNDQVFCYFGKKLQLTVCPEDTLTVPSISFADGEHILENYVDSAGLKHCFDFDGTNAKEIVCPEDTSGWPTYNPEKHPMNRNNGLWTNSNNRPMDSSLFSTAKMPDKVTLSGDDLKLLYKLVCKKKVLTQLLRKHAIQH